MSDIVIERTAEDELDELTAQLAAVDPSSPAYDPRVDDHVRMQGRHKGWYEAARRRTEIISCFRTGMTVAETCAHVGIAYGTYMGYRNRFPDWKAKADEARQRFMSGESQTYTGSAASFWAKYFGMVPKWFHLRAMNAMENCKPGNIVMMLWPTDHGKTTTFENWANMTFALDPTWRCLVVCENRDMAAKIVGQCRARCEPTGPTPGYVEDFGPFAPQTGDGTGRKAWGNLKFRVWRSSHSDQRDYTMSALGAGSKIVSARTDQLHGDDLQSTETLNKTARLTKWFRQDAITRPGEHGRTSLCGTRIDDGDVWEGLLDDEDLEDIMEVIRFPAIVKNELTGEDEALWPERYDMDQIERMRKKMGQAAFDRNWMQEPGRSRKGMGTFKGTVLDKCKRPEYSLEHQPPSDAIVYMGLDPALGGKNCVMGAEVLPGTETQKPALLIRYIKEDIGFESNEQIMARVGEAIDWLRGRGARVTDLVIEANNFQKGLAHDERLLELATENGISLTDHLTGWTKYDENIGVASMASSFVTEEILLPWAPDAFTRDEIGELIKQLGKWKPMISGKRLRQDRVMALWFIWILWRTRYKSADDRAIEQDRWTRQQTWKKTQAGLIVPVGAKVL